MKGLGLTILKEVTESRDGKIRVHFTVETCPECLSKIKSEIYLFQNSNNCFEQANRDVTRMEIFISLISHLDPAAKNVHHQLDVMLM